MVLAKNMEVQNMSSHVWRLVYSMVHRVNRVIPRSGRKASYSDCLIVGMYLWSVSWDRPLSWSCDRQNYNSWFRPRKLPSVSQFCRRIKTQRCQQILQAVHERLARTNNGTYAMFLDGKALPVGPCSQDQEARPGRIPGGFARGYKLHAIATQDRRLVTWAVAPLNVSELVVAKELLAQYKPRAVVLADGAYDCGTLYDEAAKYGGEFLTPLPDEPGKPRSRQSKLRLAAFERWHTKAAKYLYNKRLIIEQCFSNVCSYGGGLGPLPAWVRTLERVRRWVGAKILLYHARLMLRNAVKS